MRQDYIDLVVRTHIISCRDKADDVAQNRFDTLPPAPSLVSPSTLPAIAVVLLLTTFALTFVFSLLRPSKSLPTVELLIGSSASVIAGVGLVAAFCAVGVHV